MPSESPCFEGNPTTQTVYLGTMAINLTGIAVVTGLTQGYLSRIFSGERTPSLPVAKKIAKALDLNLQELVDLLEKKG
jgi:transcriptional regulator with XRE-family HTH domain